MLKAIRPFVTFDYNLNQQLTPSQKSKITRYYNQIGRLKARPHKVYRSKSSDNMSRARDYSQQPKGLPGLKAAFIPTSGGKKVKVHITKNHLKIIEDGITLTFINFNKDDLIKYGTDYTLVQMDKDARNNGEASGYMIAAGMYEIPQGYRTIKQTNDAIQALMIAYSDGDMNNYYANWLTGVRVIRTDSTNKARKFLSERKKAKDKLARERKKLRRRK